MAKRAPIVIAGTVVGAVAVLLYKPLEPAGTLASGAAGGSSGSGSTSGGGTSSGTSSSASSGSSSTARNGTFTGTAVDTRFGAVQVQATIAGGKVTAVSA